MPQEWSDRQMAKHIAQQQRERAEQLQASRLRTLPSNRSVTRDARSVSFNVKPLPGATPTEPRHRDASPIRSAIRSPSPADDERERAFDTFATDDVVEEPEEYSDEAICEQLHRLRAEIVRFGELFFVVSKKDRETGPLFDLLTNPEHRETVAFASRLLLGGPNGRQSWEDFFENQIALQGLVVGMVTQTIKDQIFDLPYFGATKTEQQRLDSWQEETASYHGFARHDQLRDLLEDMERNRSHPETDDARRELARHILVRSFKLISPLMALGDHTYSNEHKAEELLPPLKDIMEKAVSCAKNMRMAPDVAFEWTNVFKDFEFDPKIAECFNVAEMLETSPYAKDPKSGRAVLKPGQEAYRQSMIVGIVSPGLVCYRRGKPGSAPDDKSGYVRGRQFVEAGPTGFQRRMIMKNVVLLRWGRQRLRTQYLGRPGDYEKALAHSQDENCAVALWDLFVERHGGKTR